MKLKVKITFCTTLLN